jgi:hypothetical protein
MQFVIKKMKTKNLSQVNYNLCDISMNELIGHDIEIFWTGKMKCFCDKLCKSFYRQNFCYNCYWKLPQASQSVFKPELCTAHLGIEERDLEWEKKFQLVPHYVYLANSTGIKVGITRKSQIFTRWMDQGASQAIIFAEVPNRRLSGEIEVILKSEISDKTNWRKMLSGNPDDVNLVDWKNKLSRLLSDDLRKYVHDDDTVNIINYPVEKYPTKIKSLKLEKNNLISGKLSGIKGQYLIFDGGEVFNVRSHEGYIVDFNTSKEKIKTLFN